MIFKKKMCKCVPSHGSNAVCAHLCRRIIRHKSCHCEEHRADLGKKGRIREPLKEWGAFRKNIQS